MADSRNGRNVVNLAVLKRIAIAEHSFEAVVHILIVKTIEIVPTHLIYSNAHHEFRTNLTEITFIPGKCGKCKQREQKCPQHLVSLFHNH